MRPLRYLNGRTPSPVPAEARHLGGAASIAVMASRQVCSMVGTAWDWFKKLIRKRGERKSAPISLQTGLEYESKKGSRLKFKLTYERGQKTAALRTRISEPLSHPKCSAEQFEAQSSVTNLLEHQPPETKHSNPDLNVDVTRHARRPA
jgi:hypothetical protein